MLKDDGNRVTVVLRFIKKNVFNVNVNADGSNNNKIDIDLNANNNNNNNIKTTPSTIATYASTYA